MWISPSSLYTCYMHVLVMRLLYKHNDIMEDHVVDRSCMLSVNVSSDGSMNFLYMSASRSSGGNLHVPSQCASWYEWDWKEHEIWASECQIIQFYSQDSRLSFSQNLKGPVKLTCRRSSCPIQKYVWSSFFLIYMCIYDWLVPSHLQ